MKTTTTYCDHCGHDVPLGVTSAPAHEGHANLPGVPELVCLGMSSACGTATTCCLTNLAPRVMRARLRGLQRPQQAAPRQAVMRQLMQSGYASVPGAERVTGTGPLR